MRIQHNISALNTHRNLNFNNANVSKALEKLSSGYKINRAGDDAAGLAISEKMRSQIRGLDMASKNAQDSISLIQTAEGAMNEVHAMLQRGRELAVQAANDTNVNDDRDALQKEIEQIKSEITRIGTDTEFNTQKLLQGPDAGNVSAADIAKVTEKLKGYIFEAAEKFLKDGYGLDKMNAPTDIEIKFEAKDKGNTLAWVTSGGATLSMTFDTIDVIDNNMSDDELASTVAHEMTHAVMAASGISLSNTNVPDWFVEGSAEYLTGGNTRLKNALIIQVNGHTGTPQATYQSEANIKKLLQLLPGAAAETQETSAYYAAGYAATKYLDDVIGMKATGKGIEDLITELKAGKNFDTALKDVTGDATYDETKFLADLVDDSTGKGVQIVAAWDLTLAGNGSIIPGGVQMSPTGGQTADVNTNFDFNYKFDTSGTSKQSFPESLVFQIGANEGQTVKLNLPNISSKGLNIDSVDISKQEDAGKAITSFDTAIASVSDARSYLGAMQNRLEHTINNLGTASENLTAAESRIRDSDMAKEMMNFTKQNILTQAAQSMLAQANQQPQGVLQLLG